MTREDRRLVKRMAVAVIVSLGIMYAVGSVFLLIRPPSDLERRCISKTAAELYQCMVEK